MFNLLIAGGTTGLIIGCFVAAGADVFPMCRKSLLACGGSLMVVGVAVLVTTIPLILWFSFAPPLVAR
jgi:hypothetical protein